MAGLLGYAAAGALAGAGKGIVERAAALRDEAMAAQERADDLADREQDRAWKLEDRAPRASGGGSPRRASGGLSGSSATSERLVGEYFIDGVMHGRTRDGRMVPYATEDGRPVTSSATSKTTGSAGPAPQAMSDGPAQPAAPSAGGPRVGEEVEGYRFKGGDPNDMKSWERVS